jgi:hypothetical protein
MHQDLSYGSQPESKKLDKASEHVENLLKTMGESYEKMATSVGQRLDGLDDKISGIEKTVTDLLNNIDFEGKVV